MTSSTGMILIFRKAWLLAGTLAVIAGLLGMHVLTSGHASHVGDHAGHGGQNAPTASSSAAPSLVPATCGCSCPEAQEAGAPCVPSAPSAPFTVSRPQATLAALPLLTPASSPGPAYGYLPPSPTPCDLSISRT
jgi:hypothetical protein